MKFKWFVLAILGLLFLVGCDSEEKVDQKVQDHIMKTYGFEADITYRESLNEGNMGDRIYQVQRKDDPKVEFTVDLMGIWETDVVGDDYEIQEKSFLLGEKFFKKYESEVSQLEISDVVFRKSDGLRIEVNYDSAISNFKEDTIQPLMEFINLLNTYREAEKLQDSFTELYIYYPYNQSISLKQIDTVKTLEQLKEQLYKDLDVSNESLKARDESLFIELESQLKTQGYEYKFGLKSEDPIFESFGCFQEYYENGECTNGYRLYLSGDNLEKDKIFELTKSLNNHPTLTFKDVTISNRKDERIIFEDIKLIKSLSEIETVYSGTNESLGRVILNEIQ